MEEFESIIKKFEKIEEEALDALKEEYIDHDYWYHHIKNQCHFAMENLDAAKNKMIESLDKDVYTVNRYNNAVSDIEEAYKETQNTLYSKTAAVRKAFLIDFYKEISQGTEEKTAKKIIEFIDRKNFVDKQGFGSAEVWFNELKKLIES